MNLLRKAMAVFPRLGPSASSGTASPAGWLTQFGWGQASIKGLPRVDERSALSHGTVYACANVISQDLAKIPLHLYRRTEDGGKERVRDHPAARVLSRMSAPGVPAYSSRYSLHWALLLRGNAYGHIRRNGRGEIVSLEPIPNGQVSVLESGRERVYDFEDAEGIRRRVGWRDMLHLRYCAEDGWTGRSPLQVGAETISVALGAQRYAGKHVSGRGVVRGVVEHPDWFESDEVARAHAQKIRESIDDPESNGIPILPYGMSLKEVGMSPADAQLLEQRRFDREQIAAMFRVPPAKAGIFEHGLKANVEQQAIDYVTDCLLGWARLHEMTFNLALLTEDEQDEYFFEYLFDGLVRATLKDEIEALIKACGGPFMTRQEARVIRNLKKMDGADALLPPPNMAKLESAPEQEDEDDA